MLEDKIARKIADLFADNRINVYVLAALSRRYINPQTQQVIMEWWDLHNADQSTYVGSQQAQLFDIAQYNVS